MQKRIHLFAIVALCAAMPLAAAGMPETQANNTNPKVAVSIVPQATFVKQVGQSKVTVSTEIPPGASPETYEPTPRQMADLEDAQLYFSIGVPTEKSAILPKLPANMKVVDQAAACRQQYPDRKMGDGRDPHIWLSPKRAEVMVNQIADELSKIDSDNATFYKANAKAYIGKIEAASTQIKGILFQTESKTFIVYHPAFGYFADDFGLKMYALEEEGKDASPQHMAQMVDLAKQEGCKVIFYQAEIDSRQAQAFAEEIGGKAVQLDPLSGDYVNNLVKMANTFKETL
ncbi:MAG: zinc ABC transporter substrate-binding protein [Spirochaetia bacterium]|jgi:zinc transport system substrate-binding protein|nr:zinc ABC transporter substrate-binding protein [Spirochaetia bacterium]